MRKKFLHPAYILIFLGIVALACGIDFGSPNPAPVSVPAIGASSPLPIPPTVAPPPAAISTPTTTPDATATALMDSIQAGVKQYFEEGYLPSTEGTYNRVKDFTKSYAVINYDALDPTSYTARDFLFRAHYEWKSATAYPDPSGCLIGFRVDHGNYYGMVVDREKIILFRYDPALRRYTHIGANLGSGLVGLVTSAADVVFIVNQGKANVFIDERLVGTYVLDTDTLTGEGGISLGVVAGTTKDYGTQCKMTNIDLWVIK